MADTYSTEGLTIIDSNFTFDRTLPIIEVALAIEEYVASLFDVTRELAHVKELHESFKVISQFKRNFIIRDALHLYASSEGLNGPDLLSELKTKTGLSDIVKIGIQFQDNTEVMSLLKKYCAWAHYTLQNDYLFKKPIPKHPEEAFPIVRTNDRIESPNCSNRVGFDLTDKGISSAHASDEAFYCLKCHEREKDTCRKGLQGESGCPLDQKISEMISLYETGNIIAALAVVTLDNPFVALTGHRICFDCSRACIFQKQTPVDIPSIETRILKDVLSLPFGFEIYSLLTRWNPLKKVPLSFPSGRTILVVGLGPAGIGIAHEMMNLGHSVMAIDGLKIDSLPAELLDTSQLIENISDHFELLSTRYAKGFGGVVEYGITVRWDKNFLLVARLLLERRALFSYRDGVRLGSTLSIQEAFENYHVDHIALCIGAGSPNTLSLPNHTIPGVRMASDFLMALHLGDGSKLHTFSTPRIQLPIGVIGGGLTATDAATEALAYYAVQVLNFFERINTTQFVSDDPVAHLFFEHGRILTEEKKQAELEGRDPNFLPYLQKWGGATIYYRNSIWKTPASRLNPHELKKALEEGVWFEEHAEVASINNDTNGELNGITLQNGKIVPLKTLLIAIGTNPNTAIAQEEPDLTLDGKFFSANHPFFVYTHSDNRTVSYLGDVHPEFSGSVVKALASAKKAAPYIHATLNGTRTTQSFGFKPYVDSIEHHEGFIYLSIHAPEHAKNYKPGQLFKLQLYTPGSEPLPLLPILVKDGFLHFKIFSVGATTKAIRALKKGDRLYVMGPTGSSVHDIPHSSLHVVTDENMKEWTQNFEKYPISVGTLNSTKAEAILLIGQESFVASFLASCSLTLPIYLIVPTQLQCMMKQVCAQCIYLNKKTNTLQFACAKNIVESNEVTLSSIHTRRNFESLERKIIDKFLK